MSHADKDGAPGSGADGQHGAAAAAEAVGPVPKCFVFDLDNCCWSPEMYQMSSGAPFAFDAKSNVCTAQGGRGEQVQLLGDVPEVWKRIRNDPTLEGSRIAVASCCDEPTWARELLSLFEVEDGVKMQDCLAQVEIRFDNKQRHLRLISEGLGVPLQEMVFFDDNQQHCRDVTDLGVTVVHVPYGGVTHRAFEQALQKFAQRPVGLPVRSTENGFR